MSITIIEGFKVYDSPTKKSIIINSDFIEECMQVYYKYNLDGVAITIEHDYKLQNVDFLIDHPSIKELSVSEGIKDLDAIHNLKSLKWLLISGKNRKIDFSNFICLEELIADWSPYFLNMEKCKQLQGLSLYGYKPKSKDCSDLSKLTWIKKFLVSQSNITSLKGLDNFNQLEEISFFYCSKLEKISDLEKSKELLVTLLFDNCKAINNHKYVTLFRNLKILAFNYCGTIPSIGFIKNMTSLKSFRFMATDIEDGDISSCIGLEYVAFTNKRHFSHTMEEVNAS